MILYLVLGGLLLWLGYRVYRRSPGVQRGRWRVGSALLAAALLATAAFLAVRGEYPQAALAGVAALGLAGAARSQRGPRPKATAARDLSAAEARAILGVGQGADEVEVRAAYTRLMRLAHPDKGGTSGLAAQLNAARDRLLKP
jgi:hypothetical protein